MTDKEEQVPVVDDDVTDTPIGDNMKNNDDDTAKRRGSFSSSSSEESNGDDKDDAFETVVPTLSDHFTLVAASNVIRSRKNNYSCRV